MTREQKAVRALFIKLKRSSRQTFPTPGGKLTAPSRKGVYVIYKPRGKVAHVGSTPRAKGGIAQRLRNHLAALSSFTIQYLKRDGSKLRGKYKFSSIVIGDPRRRALVEAYAIGHLCPAHIGLGQLAKAA